MNDEQQQQAAQVAVLKDLRRLRELRKAKQRITQTLGNDAAVSLRAAHEEELMRQALLRNEAKSRVRESTGKARTLTLAVSFSLADRGQGVAPSASAPRVAALVKAALPRPLSQVRALRVVGGTLPHPLAPTFRRGHDDCVPLAYTQRWPVDKLRMRLVGDDTQQQQGSRQLLSFSAAIDVAPAGLAATVSSCFVGAAASGGRALRDVMLVRLLGMDDASTLAVGAATAPTPTGTRYAFVSSDYTAYWLGSADARALSGRDEQLYVLIHAAPGSLHKWSAGARAYEGKGDFLQAVAGGGYAHLLSWSAAYPTSHVAAAAVTAFVAAVTTGVVATATTAVSAAVLERTAVATLQFQPHATLQRDQAAFVLESAVNHYAKVLELGTASAETTDEYLHLGTYGEHIAFMLDPPASAAVTRVVFAFGSAADGKVRSAAAVFGLSAGSDFVIERGKTKGVLAPHCFMYHRTGRTMRVVCSEVLTSRIGSDDEQRWFDYGGYHEQAQADPSATLSLPTGSYGGVEFSPELPALRALTLQFYTRELNVGGGEHERHDEVDVPVTARGEGPSCTLVLEVDVAPF